MQDSLSQKTIRALIWSFIEAVGMRGVRLVLGIVLARLLFPEQFGLIGMLTIFMVLAQSFLDGGFGAALIQKRETTPLDMCSIFYFNLAVGVAVAALLFMAAPWIAGFYSQPVLTPLARFLSLTFVINSFGLIQTIMLTKQINFKTLTKVTVLAGLSSGTIGVIMALNGFGVWSLAVQIVCNSLFGTILLWLLGTWRPEMLFSFNSLKSLFGFGSRMLASTLISNVFENIYLLVIGKIFSPADLGFYTRANSLQEAPSHTLSWMVGRVTFPVFSSIQDDRERLRKGMKKAVITLAMISFPMMIGLAVTARPLVLVLLSERWAESIPYLQLLCFAGLLYPFHMINLNLLQAVGASKLVLHLEMVKKSIVVLTIAVTYRWGISAIIYGMIATSIIFYYVNSYYTQSLIDYPISEQLSDLFPYFAMAVLMGIVVHALGYIPLSSHFAKLFLQTIVGMVIYCFLCRVFGLTEFMKVWQRARCGVASLRVAATG